MVMIKGDIVKGVKTLHPIVFLKREGEDQFIGCIITHSSSADYPNNIGLQPEHFFEKDENEINFEVLYDKSYFVKLSLIKKNDWGPFKTKGKLTQSGIDFIETYLKKTQPTLWRDYIGR